MARVQTLNDYHGTSCHEHHPHPLLAEAIEHVHNEKPVTPLFE